ncbi:MAG TPA: Rv1355c family protein [Bacteroidia bacterium]|nr:Rv1355c family protein [Bacteroidia bacterium]
MNDTIEALRKLTNSGEHREQAYKPKMFDLHQEEDKMLFNQVLKIPGLIVYDTLEGQLNELVKYREPHRKFKPEELKLERERVLNGRPIVEYGLWVFYPWSNRLVHILGKDEFILIRTSRNQYKITPEERDILSHKKIGVIGLSVGQSVALTLAMERICGELRLADFDLLELTNMNRIRTGLHNLGLPKVYSVAREIAEIDPFLNVKCFPEGILESNMDTFFCEGGNLDLMIEESDGFDIKILSRYKARELKIPVLMEASDRCMVDVERFDLEPGRSILHGLVDHLDIPTLKSLKTTEEKIPYMLDVLGIDTASLRLKASMLEIEQSINTWPQLASAVTMGGGITADVARRLLLDQFRDSGRYFVDVEEIIGNKSHPALEIPLMPELKGVNAQELASAFQFSMEKDQYPLTEQEAARLVETACTAPSGGNFQPWRWVFTNHSLLLYNAFEGSETMLGTDNLPSLVAFGAAQENLELQSASMGLHCTATVFPDAGQPALVALFRFHKAGANSSSHTARLQAIGKRLTNRNLGERSPLNTAVLTELSALSSEVPGSALHFITDPSSLDTVGEILGDIEKIRLLEDMGHRDFVNEIRWTREENEVKRDGVDLRTLDISNAERVGLQVSRDKNIIRLLNQWNGGGAFKKLTKKSIDSAAAVGVITMPNDALNDYLQGGRLMQKVWLEANARGIAFQPVASSLFIYARVFRASGKGLSEKGIRQLMALRPAFEKTFGLNESRKGIFFFRLSMASEPVVRSLRKPLEEVFSCL